ncbi:hypothetical protein KKH23_09800 [Patescibacteria group bacterium]|nr:hypothetical protein [Patescibacteria group bacterium]
MFDAIDPNGDAFESLKSFCTLIGEGRLYPEKEEYWYHYVDHPVIQGETLMVFYDSAKRLIYLAPAVEGVMIDVNNPPIFYYWNVDGPLFPETAFLDREGVSLGFPGKMEGSTMVRKISHFEYQQLKMLFDLENPFPWKEVDERGKPVKLDDNYLT